MEFVAHSELVYLERGTGKAKTFDKVETMFERVQAATG
jgi:hypothetical protein